LLQKEPAKHDELQTGSLYLHKNCNDSQKQVAASINNTENTGTTTPARNVAMFISMWRWIVFLFPRAVCVIVLSLVYLGLAILSIRMLRLSTQQY
ncbi:unnamed protein product, partial [Candidula unifasciata]